MVDYNFIRMAETAFGLMEGALQSRSRLGHIVIVRHALNNIFRREFGYSYVTIGRIMKRDHATIIHSTKQHNLNWFDYNHTYETLCELFYYIIQEKKANIDKYSVEKCEEEINKAIRLISTKTLQIKRLRHRKNMLTT